MNEAGESSNAKAQPGTDNNGRVNGRVERGVLETKLSTLFLITERGANPKQPNYLLYYSLGSTHSLGHPGNVNYDFWGPAAGVKKLGFYTHGLFQGRNGGKSTRSCVKCCCVVCWYICPQKHAPPRPS